MSDPELWRVSLRSATFGVEVSEGVVVRAAPIAKWAIGQPWRVAHNWFKKKGGVVTKIG